MRNPVLSSRGCFTLGVCLAATLAVLGSETRAAAQDNQGKYITQAAKRLTDLVGLSNEAGYTLAPDRLSVGGGWIRQGRDSWVTLYTIKLDAGKQYRVLAAGDNDARDVDVEVTFVKTGDVVAKDTKKDPTAVVNYSPKTTGMYMVRVRLFEARSDDPCVCLAIVMVKR